MELSTANCSVQVNQSCCFLQPKTLPLIYNINTTQTHTHSSSLWSNLAKSISKCNQEVQAVLSSATTIVWHQHRAECRATYHVSSHCLLPSLSIELRTQKKRPVLDGPQTFLCGTKREAMSSLKEPVHGMSERLWGGEWAYRPKPSIKH